MPKRALRRELRAGALPGLLGAGEEELVARRLALRVEGAPRGDTTPAGGAGARDGRPSCSCAHQRVPDRRRAADAADVVHRLAAGVADPHADGVAVGEADAPVVAQVLAGAGLHRGEAARGQRAVQAEGARAGAVVGQDVGDEVHRRRVGHAARGRAGAPAPARRG